MPAATSRKAAAEAEECETKVPSAWAGEGHGTTTQERSGNGSLPTARVNPISDRKSASRFKNACNDSLEERENRSRSELAQLSMCSAKLSKLCCKLQGVFADTGSRRLRSATVLFPSAAVSAEKAVAVEEAKEEDEVNEKAENSEDIDEEEKEAEERFAGGGEGAAAFEAGSAASASSRTRCTLVPPTPKLETPALRGTGVPSAAVGAQGFVPSCTKIGSKPSSGENVSIFPFRCEKWAVGTSVLWCMHSTVLINPVMPAAQLACPMLPLTLPIAHPPATAMGDGVGGARWVSLLCLLRLLLLPSELGTDQASSNAETKPAISIASPTCVAVAWHST
mmetsp:Transcript_49698/g.97451  ORF Transcript_49698/g.97451 Transcript_49698/m.97451 type:complete len:337 (-) Transcript_49698:225-1235(-)